MLSFRRDAADHCLLALASPTFRRCSSEWIRPLWASAILALLSAETILREALIIALVSAGIAFHLAFTAALISALVDGDIFLRASLIFLRDSGVCLLHLLATPILRQVSAVRFFPVFAMLILWRVSAELFLEAAPIFSRVSADIFRAAAPIFAFVSTDIDRAAMLNFFRVASETTLPRPAAPIFSLVSADIFLAAMLIFFLVSADLILL